MVNPDIHTSFEYAGQTILVDWYAVTNKDAIPNLPWQQVYAVGNFEGRVPLVTSSSGMKQFNLPGGTIESDETIEQTLVRELVEECNMRVVSWEPLGYQILTEPNGTNVPQFRAYATLEKIGEFVNDPGGNVIKNTLVPLDEVASLIDYGLVGDEMIRLASPYFAEASS